MTKDEFLAMMDSAPKGALLLVFQRSHDDDPLLVGILRNGLGTDPHRWFIFDSDSDLQGVYFLPLEIWQNLRRMMPVRIMMMLPDEKALIDLVDED